MALVVITSPAAAAPATAAAAAVLLILRYNWHHLQEVPGVGAAPRTWGASNTASMHSTKPGTTILSVIYNAIISYSIDMNIKHFQGHCACECCLGKLVRIYCTAAATNTIANV